MLRTRVIPVLLLKNRGFYKGRNFKNHRYIGDPINTIKLFNDKEVDELVILDIQASKSHQNIDFGYLQEIASEAFMPVAYGGGIRTLEDAKRLFGIGIEKIIINTAAIDNPQFITDLVNIFGSQSIIFSLDTKKTFFGYKVFSRCGSIKTRYIPTDIALKMQALGVGEMLLNNIDKDGTLAGYDLELIHQLSQILSIPLIACGGASSLEDMKKAKDRGAHAMAASSLFVYHGPHRAVLISYPRYDQLRTILGEFE